MSLLVLLLGASLSWSQTVLKSPGQAPVYQAPRDGARVLFYMHDGEKAEVSSLGPDYYKARIRRNGRTLQGYLLKADMQSEFDLGEESGASVESSGHEWAIGADAAFAYDVQSAKSYLDGDQVTYQFSNYTSASARGEIFAQYGVLDFWRLSLAMQQTNYAGTAKTNVPGAVSQSLTLGQTIFSASLKKGWAFFSSKHVYWGLGAELAKITAVTLTLGGTNFPTTSQDQAIYIEGMGFAGGNWFLSESWSIFSEIRLSAVVNESPLIYGVAAQVGLMYWL